MEQFEQRVWKCYFEAEFQVHYWSVYGFWAGHFQSAVKVILGLSSAASLTGLFIVPSYQWHAAFLGSAAAMLATVVLPALEWDNIKERIEAVRNGWIDVRSGLEVVWDELGDESQAKLERQYRVWSERAKEIERRSLGLPIIKRFQQKAYEQAQQLAA